MTAYCTCETPMMDVEHDAGCRRCGLPVDFSPPALTWAATGSLNSLDHVAVIEPFQTVALCGTAIAGTKEIRPRTLARLCPRCARELRKLQVDPQQIGIENDLY